MNNTHIPPVPRGQPSVPAQRRQHESPYPTFHPSMRATPGYIQYPQPPIHANGPPTSPYPPQYQWYPYQQPPPHPQFQPYGPMIVSSYPRPQPPPLAVAGAPSIHQTSNASTPLSSFVSTPPLPATPNSASLDGLSNLSLFNRRPIDSPSTPGDERSSPARPYASLPPKPEFTNPLPVTRPAFQPPLPWLSVPNAPFPPKFPRRRRKAKALEESSVAVEFPAKGPVPETNAASGESSGAPSQTPRQTAASKNPTAPPTTQTKPTETVTSRPIVPVVPAVPVLPPASHPKLSSTTAPPTAPKSQEPSHAKGKEAKAVTEDVKPTPLQEPQPVRAPPKSWADLVRTKGSGSAANGNSTVLGNGVISKNKSESIQDVLNSLGDGLYENKVSFLEPRGLVNTGNMCYMNSVLQMLIFCIPFHDFLDRIGKRAVHSIKSEFPLIDAMVMFLGEFRVIDAATSVEQLKMRLKQSELEQYGDAFIPEYVYHVIRDLPKFRDMRRGHQQDAQEFLGFLLEELHEECVHALKQGPAQPESQKKPAEEEESMADGWLEVGHKQKPAITRSSGDITVESPITKIFGGKLRSEFRVPGNKNSVTLEPYQSLQLDIGSPEVGNIVDALLWLTKPETIHGDFNSPRGGMVNATKQVFIESLPPVLILHLKRFQYDSITHGTQKIWKRIGYPLELEIPKEVFAPHRRSVLAAQGTGLPHYRLVGVIYHHGKSASGGHYTVDVRRQDGREWAHFDDTVIRRVRGEDVANAGSEEDPKLLAAALERQSASNNVFGQFEMDETDQESDLGWNQVNGGGTNGQASKRSISAVPSGGETPGKRTPSSRYSPKDSQAAYLLFYEKVSHV